MKKIVLLVLIAIAIPIIIIEDTSKDYNYYNDNYPDLPKDEKWEYVKDRIAITHFRGSANKYDFKYTGPILFNLTNATKKDSIAFNEFLVNLKEVLPNKEIEYFKNYTGYNFDDFTPIVSKFDVKHDYSVGDLKNLTIRLNFVEIKDVPKTDSLSIKAIKENLSFRFDYTNTSKELELELGLKKMNAYHKPKMSFGFTPVVSIEDRKELIEYESFQLIGIMASKVVIDQMVDSEIVWSRREKVKSEKNEIGDLDWFFIQKLYSENLYKEFRSYLYKTYPWRYASNYLNKEKTKVFATWLCVVMGVVLFMLGFSLLYKKNYKEEFFKYFMPTLFTLISVLYVYKIYTYIIKPYEFEHWRQYIAIHIIFSFIAGFISLFLMLFDKYLIKDSLNISFQIVLKVIFTCLIGLVPVLLVFLAENNSQMWYSLNSFFLVIFGFALGRGLLLYLDYFSQNLIKQKDLELSNLKALKSQAEVKLLQSQINPHFLYNALNSIASLAQTDGAKTEKMALSLSDLFKYTINRKGKKNSTIGDEVEMVKNYLEVEQIRFGDRLNFKIEVDESLEHLKIPMFLIQPLIENAVKHGVSKIEGEGNIELKIEKSGVGVLIIIKDNGQGFPDGLVSGHGLQTVHDLLRLSFGDLASLNWVNTPDKQIIIKINKIGDINA